MTAGSPTAADEAFQITILQGVSRTFALTIPVLPASLSRAVGNAYLLCRIADTIEDDAGLTFPEKQRYSDWFNEVVQARADAQDFGQTLAAKLAPHATAAERELVLHTDQVIARVDVVGFTGHAR